MLFMINLLFGYGDIDYQTSSEQEEIVKLIVFIFLFVLMVLALYQLLSLMFKERKSPKARKTESRSFKPLVSEDGITTHQKYIKAQGRFPG